MYSPVERISRLNPARGWYGTIGMAILVVATLTLGPSGSVHGLQQHTLVPGQESGAQAPEGTAHPQTAPKQDQKTGASSDVQGAAPAQEPHKAAEPKKGAPPEAPAQEPAKPAEHVAEHGAHGPVLPEVSPIPGVTFVETMIKIMKYELHGRFLGWRPNDMVFGRFTDNVNNYQLGVLEAIRFTTFRLKDSLTRMGDADTYDPDLEQALNLFMNRATLFWFPSAETAYGEAVQHLERFVTRLKAGQRSFYPRVDNFRLLMTTYKDLLGNVNKSLIVSPVSWFKVDDYFYYATGIAHVYYELLRVVRVMYENQLKSTLNALELVDEITHELHRVEEMDPWIVLDSDLDGLLANHRANLNAPLSEVTHILGILSSF
ncbi:MAG: DUF2333 family protein [Syntrophobacteraceae bacterium]